VTQLARLHEATVFAMSDFDSKFMQDDELRSLLRQWSVPDAPGSLDQRVAAAYQQAISSSAPLSNSALNPQRGNEVVKMKFCDTCQEEFADRFSFCPVDGTPLSLVPAAAVKTSAPEPEASRPASETATFQKAEAQPFKAPSSTISPSGEAAAAVSAPAVPAPAGLLGEYHLTILEDTGLASRLAGELGGVAHNYKLTWPEFKRDPFGFVKRSVQGYGQVVGSFLGRRDALIGILISVLAMGVMVAGIYLVDRTQTAGPSRKTMIVVAIVGFIGLIGIFSTWLSRDAAAVMGAKPSDSRNVLSGIVAAFAILLFVVGGVFFWGRHQQARAAELAKEDDLELTQMITDIPNAQPTPDEGTAGMAKGNGGGSKPKQEKAGGGGGGGREEQAPASFGKLPQVDLRIPQVVAPDPHPPVIKNPALPMPATLDADPALFPPDTRQLNYGDPKSKSTTASSGPGTGNGIGNGTGGGVGPGSGGGYGPGNGGNTGGGERREGGGGPGGGGGGTDYSRIFSGREVTSKARVLDKPEPTYTEAARKNQITGTVVLRAVFSASGQITNISAVSRLPDGLTERAMAAAKGIRFVPATKDGHPVSMWMELQYNFNLY
jgi:TonB family protein